MRENIIPWMQRGKCVDICCASVGTALAYREMFVTTLSELHRVARESIYVCRNFIGTMFVTTLSEPLQHIDTSSRRQGAR